jgi:hypothetical protein
MFEFIVVDTIVQSHVVDLLNVGGQVIYSITPGYPQLPPSFGLITDI